MILKLRYAALTLLIQKESVYVSDYELVVESALDGAEHEFEGVTVTEVIDKSLVMVHYQGPNLKRLSHQ